MAHRAHHRPVSQPSEKFERRVGGEDPAARDEAAHTSARILLERGRQNSDPEVAARLIDFTDEYGIEALAQLWSHSPARSLPGALWRMYSLRDMVRRYPKATAQAFSTGMGADYRSHLLAGVPDPPGASEVVKTADKILAGLYSGDIDIALERLRRLRAWWHWGCVSTMSVQILADCPVTRRECIRPVMRFAAKALNACSACPNNTENS